MNDAKTYKKLKSNLPKLHSLSIVNIKIILWIGIFSALIPIALAQTGLFNVDTATDFAVTGIIFVLLIIVFKEVAKNFLKRLKGG